MDCMFLGAHAFPKYYAVHISVASQEEEIFIGSQREWIFATQRNIDDISWSGG